MGSKTWSFLFLVVFFLAMVLAYSFITGKPVQGLLENALGVQGLVNWQAPGDFPWEDVLPGPLADLVYDLCALDISFTR